MRVRPAPIVSLAMCVTLSIAGCSATPEPTSPVLGHDDRDIGAEESALKPIDQGALRAVVDAAVKDEDTWGDGGAAHPARDVRRGRRHHRAGAQTPPEANTHFRIASNTKTMTAAVIVLLAQDGKLKLGDPVSAYIPNVPNGTNITIEDLLKMRSGLYNYTDDPELSAALDADPAKAFTPQDLLAIAFRHPPQFAPDTPMSTATPTTCCWASSPKRSAGGRWPSSSRNGCLVPLGLDTDVPARHRRHRHARSVLAWLHVRRNVLRAR